MSYFDDLDERPDMLDTIYDRQLELQQSMGYDFEVMSQEEKSRFIKEFTLHAICELQEMLAELPYFKPWKKYNEYDFPDMIVKAREEYVDVIHFLMNIAIGLDMTPEMIYDGYLAKNNINHDRQKDTQHYQGGADKLVSESRR